jgi:hypothetical protein
MSNSEFKFYCSHCDQPLKCDPCHAGRQIQCPGCQHLIRIPNLPAGTGFTHVHPESGQTWAAHVPKGNKAWWVRGSKTQRGAVPRISTVSQDRA